MIDSEMKTTQRIVIRQSLWRPILVAGGERDATFLLWLICIGVPIIINNYWFLVFFVPAGIIGQFFLKSLAKKDPIFIGVLRRYSTQQSTYSGLSSIYAKSKVTKVPNNKSLLVIFILKILSIFMKEKGG